MGSIKWDDAALGRVVAEAAAEEVEGKTAEIESRANALSAGYRTGRYHRDHKSPAVGNTQPRYESDVKRFKGMPIGIVYTGNYAAMKDNHENNTLLKARD